MSTDKNNYLIVKSLINEYLLTNCAARELFGYLELMAVNPYDLVDHVAFRTFNREAIINSMVKLGYVQAEHLKSDIWTADVLRHSHHQFPAIFIDSPNFEENNVIHKWVTKFGDSGIHHAAILVGDIVTAKCLLEKRRVPFASGVLGNPDADIRQVFTKPEIIDGEPHTVLELIQRKNGFTGFDVSIVNNLMSSTQKESR